MTWFGQRAWSRGGVGHDAMECPTVWCQGGEMLEVKLEEED